MDGYMPHSIDRLTLHQLTPPPQTNTPPATERRLHPHPPLRRAPLPPARGPGAPRAHGGAYLLAADARPGLCPGADVHQGRHRPDGEHYRVRVYVCGCVVVWVGERGRTTAAYHTSQHVRPSHLSSIHQPHRSTAVAFNTIMFVVPLSSMASILKHRDSSPIFLPWAAASTVCSLCWVRACVVVVVCPVGE